jgi:hypothetical protein
MPAIRQLIAALPDEAQARRQPELPLHDATPRPLLHAHFAAGIEREDEDQ